MSIRVHARPALALCLAISSAAGCGLISPSNIDEGTPGRAKVMESGWSASSKLEVSDDGWEDSPYITRDGRFVMFFYHPAPDIVTDPPSATKIQLDARIYVSERPFKTKSLHPVSTEDAVTEAGPYIALNKSFFYFRTFPFGGGPHKIVRDGQTLDLGTGQHEQNPHYCDAMDELYFDAADQQMYVHKGGRTTRLPAPVNAPGSRDFQPFLTDDCQTMYFTSTRAAGGGIFPFQVYRTRRSGEFQWSEPELFISHPDGVGEFSMTADGKEVVFIELSRVAGGARTDIYHSRR